MTHATRGTKPEPDFQRVAELATRQGAERLAAAMAQIECASGAALEVQRLLRPLIGSRANECVMVSCDLRSHLLAAHRSLRELQHAAARLELASPTMSEDAVLQQLEGSGASPNR